MPPTRRGAQVNVLKKVRTSQGWRLCPIVRESNGRLRDRVRIGGRVEVHTEGVYYLEWREDGRRLRTAIPNAAEVLELQRLQARQTGIVLGTRRPEMRTESFTSLPRAEQYAKVTLEPPSSSNAERLLLAGIEAYIQDRVDAVLRARLASTGALQAESALASLPPPPQLAPQTEPPAHSHYRKPELPGPAQSVDPDHSPEAASTIAV